MAKVLTAKPTGYRMDFETENFVVANTVRSADDHHGQTNARGDGDDNLVVAFDWMQTGTERSRPVRSGDYAGSLQNGKHDAVQYSAGVRRLTPLECERLQGFPDHWTEGMPDSHRYRMLSNAVATVCAQWLGHRLVWVDARL
jgi:site-specific DNA-cytosine methylase